MTDKSTFSVGLILYRLVLSGVSPFLPAYLNQRKARGKEDEARINERFGSTGKPRPSGPLVWIHGASVGEAVSVLPLIERILDAEPALHILLTTGTITSAELMAKRLPDRAIHQFVPIDTQKAVNAFFNHWQPDLGLWVESELWPNLLITAAKRHIPLGLINARMSDKSYRSWRKWPSTIRTLLNLFDVQLSQNENVKDTLSRLGATRAVVAGNLKFVADPLPVDEAKLQTLAAQIAKRPRWLAASTHIGEEEMVAAAHKEIKKVSHKFLTILVPRHPERGPVIADMLRSHGLTVARRSQREPINPDTDIYLADTLGELGLFYRLTEITFIGGSLVPHGGQNLLEAARLDCAILHGPHIHNFDTIYADFEKAEASRKIASQQSLAPTLFELLHNETKRHTLMKNAKALSEKGNEILNTYMHHLRPLLEQAKARHATNPNPDELNPEEDLPRPDQPEEGRHASA